MKVRPMKSLVGNTVLIITKTVVIASLKLFYGDLTCSFADSLPAIQSREFGLICRYYASLMLRYC